MSGQLLLLLSVIATLGRAAAPPATFNRDIAPLVSTHCAPCHHGGGIGPFSLLTYDDVRKHASQIAAVTSNRYMPPWPPEPGSGDFKGDRHLTPAQIQLIAAWVNGGKQEGSGAPPPVPVYTDEWQLGPPDLVLRMPQAFSLPASGSDIFRNFIIPSDLTETRYVRGFELRLNNKRAVHHANVVLDRTQSLRPRNGRDGQPGFAGMDVTTEAAPNDFDPDSHFLFWKPASVLQPEPADMSWRLDSGTDLILNLHLQPTGKTEAIQAEIGLYFSSQVSTKRPMLLQLEHDGDLSIPPGDRHFTVTDQLTIPVDVDLLAIYPHAHYLGKRIEAWATTPDGRRQSLIRIPDWDINWQATYEYRKPVFLPKGTVVAMRIVYDNSAANPRNPTHPPILVKAGNRSRDEMGHVWLQVLPRVQAGTGDPRWLLQEAAMRRRLDKYPGDFLAHYNLGALQQSRGKLPEAAASYNSALRLEPENTTARNSLATIYMLQDNFPSALEELRKALAVQPDYLNARYNLARSLAAMSDLPGALAEYVAYLKIKPDDRSAQEAVASIYLSQKDYGAAAEHLGAAARTNPADADLQANLGAVLAMSGNLKAAIAAFEASLRLNPGNTLARQNLARAQAQLSRATH